MSRLFDTLFYINAENCRFEYLWQDSENYKRPTKMPAPSYIEHLMGWVQSNIDNEAVFPSRIGRSCLANFKPQLLMVI
jgi:hypothetical protein